MKKIQVNKFILFSWIVWSLCLTSCLKEETDYTEKILIDQTKNVNFSISGVLTDHVNLPISNVSVQIDKNSTSTDENGFYHFENINAQGPRIQMQISHESYFKTFKTINTEDNSHVHISAQLDKLESPKIVSSAIGGEITIENNFTINFPENAFMTTDGNEYHGDVRIFTTSFDPTDKKIGSRLPSDLQILDNDLDLQYMQMYSGIGVELYGSNNEALQIAKNVNLSMPVPPSLLADAPSSITLGHFDEELGVWKEEGIAFLENTSYVAEVHSFSYWCALIKHASTKIYGYYIEDSDDPQTISPIKDLYIEIYIDEGVGGSTRTNEDGFFSMTIPQDIDLQMDVYANTFSTECGESLLSEIIPAVNSITSLGTTVLSSPSLVTISGLAHDCNNMPLNSGYILLKNAAGSIIPGYIDQVGKFSVSMYSCDDEVSITIYDTDFNFASETVYLPDVIEDLYLENIVACEMTSIPPYMIRAITGQDTIIGSGNNTNFYYSYNATTNNLMSILVFPFDADIKNTSQPLNEGNLSINVGVRGIETQQCSLQYCEVILPLKDSVDDQHSCFTNANFPQTSGFIYNCIDGMEYLHIIAEGVLIQNGIPEVVTHRDPTTYIDIYLPLE